jgi:L-rhamnose mutarotase
MTDWAGLYSRVFLLTVRPGMEAEYRRRHDEIWPELVALHRAQGIVRFEIWFDATTNRVFGHQLRTVPPEAGDPVDEVMLRWRAHMADVLEMVGERPAAVPLERVYFMTA